MPAGPIMSFETGYLPQLFGFRNDSIDNVFVKIGWKNLCWLAVRQIGKWTLFFALSIEPATLKKI